MIVAVICRGSPADIYTTLCMDMNGYKIAAKKGSMVRCVRLFKDLKMNYRTELLDLVAVISLNYLLKSFARSIQSRLNCLII